MRIVIVALCLAYAAAPAWARGPRVKIAASSVAGGACSAIVTVSQKLSATVLVQEYLRARWRTVASGRITGRSLTLTCPAAVQAGGTRRFKAFVRRGGRVVARSPVVSTRVLARPLPAPAPAPVPAPVPPAPTPTPVATPAPWNPAQFGVEGTGGAPGSAALALLSNAHAVFDSDGTADLRAGRIDPRVVALLTKLTETHTLVVSALATGQSRFSLFYLGRGVKIASVDGVLVNPGHLAARELAADLASLDTRYRPDAIGTPWAISAPGYYTSAATQDHLEIAFREPIDPGWS